MIHRGLGLLALTMVSFAIAQAPPIAHTHGQGVVQDRDQHRAEFRFEANKFAGDATHPPVVRGVCNFSIASATGDRGLRINCPIVQELGADGTQARFAGNGVLTRMTQHGPENVRGRVQVAVNDRHNPTSTTTDPDLYSIRFVVPNASGGSPTVLFSFEGAVVRGDLVVRSAP